MSKRNDLPSKSISFRLVTDMEDAPRNKDGKVIKYPNDLDRQVYNVLCNLPDGTNITHFVKQAIIAYAKIDYTPPNYSTGSHDYDIIKKMITNRFAEIESRLDAIEKPGIDINFNSTNPESESYSKEKGKEFESVDVRVPDESQDQSSQSSISNDLDILNKTDDNTVDRKEEDDDLGLSDSWLNIL